MAYGRRAAPGLFSAEQRIEKLRELPEAESDEQEDYRHNRPKERHVDPDRFDPKTDSHDAQSTPRSRPTASRTSN